MADVPYAWEMILSPLRGLSTGTWITVTQRVKSEGYCAMPATEPWGTSETTSPTSNEPSSTFSGINNDTIQAVLA